MVLAGAVVAVVAQVTVGEIQAESVEMEEILGQLVNRLKAAHGEDLISVLLHGPALAHSRAAHKADYRVMVIVNQLPVEVLRRTRAVAKWWVQAGYSLPVYFTIQEFVDSLDVFPIEFREMKRAYRPLYGKDLLAEAKVSSENLRLQIEYELRGKYLRLRELYLPASDSAESLTRLMTDSIVNFLQFITPILELLGEEAPLDHLVIVRRVGKRLGVDTAVLESILHLRDEPVRLMELEAQELFARYYDCLAQIIEAVDKV